MKISYKVVLVLAALCCVCAVGFYAAQGQRQDNPSAPDHSPLSHWEVEQGSRSELAARATLASRDTVGRSRPVSEPKTAKPDLIPSDRDLPKVRTSPASKAIDYLPGTDEKTVPSRPAMVKTPSSTDSTPSLAGDSPAATTQPSAARDEDGVPTILIDGRPDRPSRPSTRPAAVARTAARPAMVKAPRSEPYVIQPGDTFASIAVAKYDNQSHWTDIAQENPLVDPTRLRPGQVIRLPHRDILREPDPTTPEPSTRTGKKHRVRPGETLSSIAQHYYGDASKWKNIYLANRKLIGPNPNRIKAGLSIVIPWVSAGTQ